MKTILIAVFALLCCQPANAYDPAYVAHEKWLDLQSAILKWEIKHSEFMRILSKLIIDKEIEYIPYKIQDEIATRLTTQQLGPRPKDQPEPYKAPTYHRSEEAVILGEIRDNLERHHGR